jgi:hypothetical protein
MRRVLFPGVWLGLLALPAMAPAQPRRSEAEFVRDKPAIGDLLPALTVYDAQGKELKTSSLRGHYSVLTFGCLT